MNGTPASPRSAAAIDPRLAQAAAALAAREPQRRVSAGRVFRVPGLKLRATLTLQAPRCLNVLESFILRAAAELSPAPTPAALSALLGLDPVFVDDALGRLAQARAIARGRQGEVTLTADGRAFRAQGGVPGAEETRETALAYFGLTDALRLWHASLAPRDRDPLLPGLTDPEREMPAAARALAAVTLKRLTEIAGPGLHAPDLGRRLTAVQQPALDAAGYWACGVLVTEAEGTGPAVVGVDLAAQSPDEALTRLLTLRLESGALPRSDLIPLTAPPP